jgi:Fe-S cluster assembly protein SufD
VQRHPELVRSYFEHDRIGADEDKWSAMNSAFWSGGAFVYVPSGVEATLPMRTIYALSGAGSATFTRSLVVAEEWSSLTYIEDFLSLDDSAAFNANVVDVVAKEGSSVRYCHVQNWGTGVWNFERERIHASRDAAVNLLQVGLGSRLTKSFVHGHIDEPGVSLELLGLVFIGGRQHIDHSTWQNHRAGQSMSDLLFKCAVLEEARSVYGGLISIDPGAQRSDAYQNNRNLLLSESARADSIPMLEIQANDVRCTHGSTTSSVDEEELFYLRSRGLPRAEAERLILEGFFSQVTDRIPLEGVKDRVSAEIEKQINKLRFE